jgi:pimeloyl-ACP methyl ester carboxylesterase
MMKSIFGWVLGGLLVTGQGWGQLGADGATASFRGALPPAPVAALSAEQEAVIAARLAEVQVQFEPVKGHERAADVEIFLKAVRYALEFDEWYDKKAEDGVKKAMKLLDEAGSRIAALRDNRTPWLEGAGWKVLGFYSTIDGSAQPYGVEIPEGLKWGGEEKAVPMWIWLHGRGDTATDLHFIAGKLGSTKRGQFQPAGTIVIHPFGRYCNGWKSAGETDVFEARDDAVARFRVDKDRIALAGFSMGGAGAWHMGAHFADQWACVHAGAGFVDVKRYQKLTPEKMPPAYEQTLWGVYDVPAYARNFFNVPLVVYSGEEDSQRDAAAYMEEVLAGEGLKMTHHIGPGMGHKYHPEVIKTVQAEIEAAVAKGRDPMPKKVVLQTRTLGYSEMFWVKLISQEKAWEDTRIEAEVGDKGMLRVVTKNVRAFELSPSFEVKGVIVDGTVLEAGARAFSQSGEGTWVAVSADSLAERSAGAKRAGQSGPIEEPLKRSFVVVLPEGDSASPAVTAWVNAESQHFLKRWRGLMRGDVRVKKASEVRWEDEVGTLVLWGDAKSNPLVAKLLAAKSTKALPFEWDDEVLKLGKLEVASATHVPVMIRPNPSSFVKGVGNVILNSGLTFREAHDRTNSLQNPKLPDWAILDITVPPDAERAGRVVEAGFFAEDWALAP